MFLGGRVKHMTRAMNDVLNNSFADVRASLAQHKSRFLAASGPRPAVEAGATPYPLRQHHLDLDLWVCAHGAVFAGTRLDIGTRFLLDFLDLMHPAASTAVDLGCGTGVIATTLARARPQMSVLATDESAGAVSSAMATVAANGLTEHVAVLRDEAMSTLPDASVDLIVCNPPFHLGACHGLLEAFPGGGSGPAAAWSAVDGVQLSSALSRSAEPHCGTNARHRPQREVHRRGVDQARARLASSSLNPDQPRMRAGAAASRRIAGPGSVEGSRATSQR
jgi:SAM-dependent methyltransferase